MNRFLVMLASMFLLSCCPDEPDTHEYLYVNKVYLNSPSSVTVVKLDGKLKELRCHNCAIQIFDDVHMTRPTVTWTNFCSGGTQFKKNIKVHLFEYDHLGGGEWDKGKFGRDNVQGL